MLLKRRDFLMAAGLSPLAFGASALAQTEEQQIAIEGMEVFDPLPTGFNGGLFEQPVLGANFGSAQPPEVYSELAAALLRGAPRNCRPIDVAYYFSNVREGRFVPAVLDELTSIATRRGSPDLARPDFLKFFAYDWERNEYFNPVIIGFFRGVGLRPYAGDQTPWCATFANWCISRSRATRAIDIIFGSTLKSFGTKSASSGSFRCWKDNATDTPVEGDIVVWAKRGTVGTACPGTGQGHVAFLTKVDLGPTGKRTFRVVGGNQGYRGAPSSGGGTVVSPKDIAQAVSARSIGESFSDRVFHSVRTAAFLR